MKTREEHGKIIEALDKEIAAFELTISALKDARRNAVKAMEDDAPFTCGCCERGTWEAHRHWSHRRGGYGKDVYYYATLIPRVASPTETEEKR